VKVLVGKSGVREVVELNEELNGELAVSN